MARINISMLRNWLDGMAVTAAGYKQDREILCLAINDNNDRVQSLEENKNVLTGFIDGGSFEDDYSLQFSHADGGTF